MSYLEMRFLIPQQVAEIIIGPNGSNVDRLHMEYRAVINISESSTSERVLTVGGLEIMPVCKLLQDLLTTLTAAGFDLYGCEYENDLSMLVDESQVDVLTNLEQLQQLVEETGARVDVFPLCCPLSTDRVVRVCGMPGSVSRCIFGLHTLLKQCPIDYSAPRQQYNPDDANPSTAGDYGGYTADYFIGFYSSNAVLSGSGNDSTSESITKQYFLPANIKSAVLGHNGSRLRHVQLESGAAISVDDARPFHCTVSITGSQEQINNARLLLRMCIRHSCIRID